MRQTYFLFYYTFFIFCILVPSMQKIIISLILFVSVYFLAPFGYSQGVAKTDSIATATNALLKRLETTLPDTLRLTILKQLADLNMETRTVQASEWISKGINLSHRNGYAGRELAFRLMELRACNLQGQFLTTIGKAKELEPLLQQTGTALQHTALLLSVGNANQRLGNYDVAATCFTKAIDIAGKNQIRDIEVRAGMNLGNLYQYLNRYDEMLLHLEASLQKAVKYGLKEDVAMIKFNMSNAEARMNNFGKAIDYLLEVLPYYEKQNNQYALGLAYANLSWCYFKAQKTGLALDYANRSYALRTALHDDAGLAHLDLNKGKIFLELGRYDSCRFYAERALEKSTKLKLELDIRDNYETLALLNERQGNFEAANTNLRHYYNWKDTIYTHEKDRVLEQEFVRFKYQALDSLTNNITQTSKQLKQYKTGSVLLAIICFVLLLAVLMLVKKQLPRFMQTGAGNNTGPAQVEEYERLQQTINRLAERNEQVERKLQEQGVSDISSLRELIASNKLHADGYWNEFMLLFSKVYPDFFERLKETYPALTQNELRICSLIKLNLGLLDMANVLHITSEGARKARYRLYKKMELNSDQELTDLLIRF